MAIEEQDKKTPIFDYDAGEFVLDSQNNVRTVKGPLALKQIILKISSTPRGTFLIYADPDNPDLNHKYGNDVKEITLNRDLSRPARISELKRVIREAYVYDPWITEVTKVEITQLAVDEFRADITINTIFDETLEMEGLPL
jgi:hypothetical protein